MDNQFSFSTTSEPHKTRTQELLRVYPQARTLIGQNRFSFFLIVGVVSLQVTLAVILRTQPWWLILLTAWFVGAFANHALFVLMHECAHNLVFKRRSANLLASILCDIPNAIPSAISFRNYHLKHHSHQGEYAFDGDLPSHWEANLVGRSWFKKALWLLLFAVFQALRPLRLRAIQFTNTWTLFNWVFIFSLDAAFVVFFGWTPIFYLLASLVFSVGLHPVGARWIQEHFLLNPLQETYSYYGSLNLVAFNVGYHNEHHDLPSVPWNKLPTLKKMAPELYDNLTAHTSWTRLLFRFLFDRSLSLYSRTERNSKSIR